MASTDKTPAPVRRALKTLRPLVERGVIAR